MKNRTLKTTRVFIAVGLSVGLGWITVRGVDWGLAIDNLSDASLPLLTVALFIFMAAALLRAIRWRLLFLDERPSVARLFIVQHEGLGLGNIMPVRIASELTQLWILTTRDGVKPSTAVAAIGMERVVDLISSSSILALALILIPGMRPLAPYVWVTIFLAVAVIIGIKVFEWGGGVLQSRIPFIGSLANSLISLTSDRILLTKSLVLSLGYWVLVGTSAWVVAIAVDLPVSPVMATLVIIGTIFFATTVPAAPSAIGSFHFAVVHILGLIDIDKSDAFPFAVIIHLLFFIPPTILAAIFLPREGFSFRKWYPETKGINLS